MKRFLLSIASLMLASSASAEYLLKRVETATGDPTYPYRQEIRLITHTAGDRVFSILSPASGDAKISGYPASQNNGPRVFDAVAQVMVDNGLRFDFTATSESAPVDSYIAPGIETKGDLDNLKANCGGNANINAFQNTVADWESGTDGQFTYSQAGAAGCNVGQDSGSGVLLAVFVSENRVTEFKMQLRVHNTAGSDSTWANNVRILEADVTFSGAASNDVTCIPNTHVFASDGVGYGTSSTALGSGLGSYDCATALASYQPDCAGNYPPTVSVDNCGVCGGDDSTCTGCRNNTACNYDATATIDDEASCDFASCVGCNNVTYLPHVDGPIPQAGTVDRCGDCGGDGTSCVTPCSFHAPGTLFPADLIYITENSNGDSTDATVKLTFNWDSTKEAPETNYYLLDAKSTGTAFDQSLGDIALNDLLNGKSVLSDFQPVGFPDFNLNSTSPGAVADSTGTGGGTISSSISADGHAGEFVYEGPDQDVLIMIGAASTCVTSRMTVDYVYIRSVYKFRVKERLSMEKTVDDSGFASYVAQYNNDVLGREPILVTQADLTQNLQTFNAQHVMKTRNLEVHSNLAGPAGHDCLGSNNNAIGSYQETEGHATVSNGNGAVTCTITATGDIANYVQAADNRDTGYDDTDIDQATDEAGEGNVAFSDFYIALALSQYTQMASQSDYSIGNTWDAIDVDWDVTTSDATGLWGKQDGSDVRTDLCRLKRHNLGGSGTDITEVSANTEISLNTHVVTTPNQPAEQDHTGVAVNDASRQGTYALNDEAHVKCSFSPFQLTTDDAGVNGARYSPLVYVRAWFDYGKGALQSDYARRLRSSKQLTSGMRKNTVHYMHIRLARSN